MFSLLGVKTFAVGGEDTSSAATTQDDEEPTSVARRLLQLQRPESRYTMSDPLNPLIEGRTPSGVALSSSVRI